MKNKLKKTMLVLLACVLLLTPLSAAAETIIYAKPGDLNSDFQSNALDYILLKRHVLGTYRLDMSGLYSADLNLDSTVDALDYIILKKIVLGTYKLQAPDLTTPAAELSDEELKKRINYLLADHRYAGEISMSSPDRADVEKAESILGDLITVFGADTVEVKEIVEYLRGVTCLIYCPEEQIREVLFYLMRHAEGFTVEPEEVIYAAPC